MGRLLRRRTYATITRMSCCYVYMLAARKDSTLYIGVTNDLQRRLGEHRDGGLPSFTFAYCAYRLVYFEMYEEPGAAIHREKQLKRWHRAWNVALVEKENPDWRDLAPALFGVA